jgi:uncharacterized membrane protein
MPRTYEGDGWSEAYRRRQSLETNVYHSLKNGLLIVTAGIALIIVPASSYGHSADEMGAGPSGPLNERLVAPADNVPDAPDHTGRATSHYHPKPAKYDTGGNEHTGFTTRLVDWLGRLHVAAIHFPIAMILGALAVEIYGAAHKTARYQEAARTMLVVGAIGASVAMVLGWFAGGFFISDRNQILTLHRWLGTAIAIAAALVAFLAVRRGTTPGKSHVLYWVLLGSVAVATGVQGFLGGTFMHGGLKHLAF